MLSIVLFFVFITTGLIMVYRLLCQQRWIFSGKPLWPSDGNFCPDAAISRLSDNNAGRHPQASPTAHRRATVRAFPGTYRPRTLAQMRDSWLSLRMLTIRYLS